VEYLQRQVRTVGELLGQHAPSAVLSIVIAELFYKFHSFTLECVAFLATWYVIDQVVSVPYRAIRARIGAGPPSKSTG
jgi:hypothetical protein